MTGKSPTPQGISALLRKAGHRRSERDNRELTLFSGYRVTAYGSGSGRVCVSHQVVVRTPVEVVKAHLAKYAETIKAAGWNVEAGEYELTVTAGKD